MVQRSCAVFKIAFIISTKRTFWISTSEHEKHYHLPISAVDLGLLD
jgi:hypothetical protein